MSRQELDDFEKEVVGKDINIPLVELTKVGDIKSDGLNPNVMDVQKFDALKKNIEKYGFIVPIITNKKLVIADGEHRLKAAEDLGMKEVPVLRLDVEEVDRRMLRQVLNKLKGVHDFNLDIDEYSFILDSISKEEFVDFVGFEEKEIFKLLDTDKSDLQKAEILAKEIIDTNPFSIIDGRTMVTRTRRWREIISIEESIGTRKEVIAPKDNMYGAYRDGVSLFNHSLAEIMIRGFSVTGENVFVPFMGGPVLGGVSLVLGRNVNGIELRPEQVELTNKSVEKFINDKNSFKVITGDACDISLYPTETEDMTISCPPYLWLEKYSELEEDLSNKNEEDFFKEFGKSCKGMYKCLKDNRFSVIIVGNIRNKDGSVIDLVGKTISLMKKAGFELYNDFIFIQPMATSSLRTRSFVKTRKMVRVNEKVLTFYKGNIDNLFREVSVADVHEDVVVFYKGDTSKTNLRTREMNKILEKEKAIKVE